jgi:UDP-2,3-diacylglucosamine pyrophosphatase LpxH
MSGRILDPVDLSPEKSLIVIADTHLGLGRNAFQRALNKGPESEPAVLGSFLGWLEDMHSQEKDSLENGPSSRVGPKGASPHTLPVWDRSQHETVGRPMRPPEHLVLLGDIMEMWDSPDESVQLAMVTTFSKLNRQKSEVVYVLGNHDQVFERDVTTSSGIMGEIKIASDVWPDGGASASSKKGEQGVRPIRAGKRQYLFVHGHQFDPGFQTLGPLTYIPGHLRRAARLGHYAWLFGLLLMAALVLWSLGSFGGNDILASIVVIILFLLVLPIAYLVIGRSLWRKIAGSRYHRERALKGFSKWWKTQVDLGKVPLGVKDGREDLTVVYGHTHITDIIDGQKAINIKSLESVTRRRQAPLLLNIPAWTKDPKHGLERAIFLYVDNGGHLFLGWDWKEKRPFHIPDVFIHARREGLDINGLMKREQMTLSDLKELNWPDGFIRRWAEVLTYAKLPA